MNGARPGAGLRYKQLSPRRHGDSATMAECVRGRYSRLSRDVAGIGINEIAQNYSRSALINKQFIAPKSSKERITPGCNGSVDVGSARGIQETSDGTRSLAATYTEQLACGTNCHP